MQLMYRTYAWPFNGVRVSSQRRLTRDAAGRPWKFIDSITADGYIEGTSQADLTAKQIALEVALSRPYGDLILFRDDGQPSATLLSNSDSITGVVITDGPHFQDTTGPEYVTQRHFVFTAEADYLVGGVGGNYVIEWSETVRISGGGPLYVCKPALVGPPQRQLVFQQTPCTATQTGSAVGALAYPAPAPAIWPFALKIVPDRGGTSPKRMGARAYTEFRTEWTYTYEWPFPLVGAPTLWRG